MISLYGLDGLSPMSHKRIAQLLRIPIEQVAQTDRAVQLLAAAVVGARTEDKNTKSPSLTPTNIAELRHANRRALVPFSSADARIILARFGPAFSSILPADIVAQALDVPFDRVRVLSAEFQQQLSRIYPAAARVVARLLDDHQDTKVQGMPAAFRDDAPHTGEAKESIGENPAESASLATRPETNAAADSSVRHNTESGNEEDTAPACPVPATSRQSQPLDLWPIISRLSDTTEQRIAKLLCGLSLGESVARQAVAKWFGVAVDVVDAVADALQVLAEAHAQQLTEEGTNTSTPQKFTGSYITRMRIRRRKVFASFGSADLRIISARYGSANATPLPSDAIARAFKLPLAAVEAASAEFERRYAAAGGDLYWRDAIVPVTEEPVPRGRQEPYPKRVGLEGRSLAPPSGKAPSLPVLQDRTWLLEATPEPDVIAPRDVANDLSYNASEDHFNPAHASYSSDKFSRVQDEASSRADGAVDTDDADGISEVPAAQPISAIVTESHQPEPLNVGGAVFNDPAVDYATDTPSDLAAPTKSDLGAEVMPERAVAELSREQSVLATFAPDEARIIDLRNGITGTAIGDDRAVAAHLDLPVGHVRRLQWTYERRLASIPETQAPNAATNERDAGKRHASPQNPAPMPSQSRVPVHVSFPESGELAPDEPATSDRVAVKHGSVDPAAATSPMADSSDAPSDIVPAVPQPLTSPIGGIDQLASLEADINSLALQKQVLDAHFPHGSTAEPKTVQPADPGTLTKIAQSAALARAAVLSIEARESFRRLASAVRGGVSRLG